MKKRKSKFMNKIKNLIILIFLLIILSISSLFFAPTEAEYNNQKNNQIAIKYTITTSLDIPNLELPKPIDGEQIVSHIDYVLSYNEKYGQASYVAYELDNNEIYGSSVRKNNFREDPTINSGSASLDDYKKSGYDRGHLIPAADQKESDEAMSDSFYMSNMSPQSPNFNRKIWADLEATIRTFANTNTKIYVTTGPILTDGPYKTIGKNEVAVPKYFYKVILDYTEPEIKSIGFILPNEESNKPLQSFATTVDEVEERTGIDFFYQLPDEQEATIEGNYDLSKWLFKEFIASNENGSFTKDTTTSSKQIESKTSSQSNSLDDLQLKIKEGITFLMMRVRVETTKLVSQFISRETLESLNII